MTAESNRSWLFISAICMGQEDGGPEEQAAVLDWPPQQLNTTCEQLLKAGNLDTVLKMASTGD